MKTTYVPTSLILLTFLVLTACGGTQTVVEAPKEDLPKVQMTADDFYNPELIKSEFTDEVDDKRYRAVGNVLEEIKPRTKIIYFVGKLRRVPTQAQIQVHWFNDNIDEPVVVTDVYGSDTFSFISSFTPPGRKFMPGNYTVRVLVNGKDAGSDTFTILGSDPFSEGIQIPKVKIAKKLKTNGAPIKPAKQFKRASNLHASFKVKNVMNPTELTISWYRGDDLFTESAIQVDGNGRFTANIGSPSGLPNGVYTVDIDHEGVTLADTKFVIGKASLGPTIDYIALGEKPGKGAMPKKESTSFREGISAVYCGLRFLDLKPNTEILIEWVMMDGDDESVYHTVRTPVGGGGSGSMSAQWSPGNIYAGDYKAVVYINDELATEKEFNVQ